MARRWVDPRSGEGWLVEAVPFDVGRAAGEPRSPMGWTLLFSSAQGRGDIPVGYELGAELEHLSDRELILLLDAALH